MKRIITFFTIFIILLTLVSCKQEEVSDVSIPLAPDFTVLNQKGENVQLSDYIGKPVVINFWATWCPPCKAELPDFDKACAEYDDVVFLMVNLTDGSRDTKAVVDAFIAENGYTFPVYYDTAYSAAYAYNVSSIPATYFISADGSVASSHVGMLDYATLVSGIEGIR